MTRLLLSIVIVAGCSKHEQEPQRDRQPPARTEPPALTEQQKQEVSRAIVEQANANVDANTSPCDLPPTIDTAEVTGSLVVSDFGGKRTYNYLGDVAGLAGVKLGIYSSTAPKPASFTLRPREGRDDHARPYVVELVRGDRALDAAAGTLVIDKVDHGVVTGHLDGAELREHAYDYTYLPNGCTARITRATFRYTPRD